MMHMQPSIHIVLIIACNFTCPEGFEPFPTCDGCNLTDICLAEQPCQNGGVCALVSPAVSDYYCNCAANFNGTNCTGKLKLSIL